MPGTHLRECQCANQSLVLVSRVGDFNFSRQSAWVGMTQCLQRDFNNYYATIMNVISVNIVQIIIV